MCYVAAVAGHFMSGHGFMRQRRFVGRSLVMAGDIKGGSSASARATPPRCAPTCLKAIIFTRANEKRAPLLPSPSFAPP